MLAVLLLLHTAQAACPDESSLRDISDRLRDAERAFGEQDAAAFYAATSAARDELPCLREPLTPGVAALWHRNAALERSVNPKAEDRPLVIAALRAMLEADPGYSFPATLAPAGSVLPGLLAAARAEPTPTRAPLGVPEGTLLLLDGEPARDRAGDLPVVVQVLWLRDMSVHATVPLALGQPLPDLRAAGALPPIELPAAAPPPRLSRPATLALAGGTAALSLVAGVALGLGEANRGSFLDPDTPASTLPALVDRSHALSLIALGAGLGAAGLGAAFVVSGRL